MREIIVTARERQESPLKAPVVANVVTAQQIVDAQVVAETIDYAELGRRLDADDYLTFVAR